MILLTISPITTGDCLLVNSTSGCIGTFSYSGTDCGFNVNPDTGDLTHLFYTELGKLSAFDTNGTPRAGSMGID